MPAEWRLLDLSSASPLPEPKSTYGAHTVQRKRSTPEASRRWWTRTRVDLYQQLDDARRRWPGWPLISRGSQEGASRC